MYLGKTLFAQVMGYVPWKTFGRIVDRYGGDIGCAVSVAPSCFASWPSRS